MIGVSELSCDKTIVDARPFCAQVIEVMMDRAVSGDCIGASGCDCFGHGLILLPQLLGVVKGNGSDSCFDHAAAIDADANGRAGRCHVRCDKGEAKGAAKRGTFGDAGDAADDLVVLDD